MTCYVTVLVNPIVGFVHSTSFGVAKAEYIIINRIRNNDYVYTTNSTRDTETKTPRI